MASFGLRRLLKVRKGGLLYKFWRPAIPRGVRPLKRVQTSARAALLPSKADQRQIGGCTWPVLVFVVANGQFWSQEAANGQVRMFAT